MKPHFSIVIPIYNSATTLMETLESITGQSYLHFEVICVNDGSTDEGPALCRKWKSENPQLHIKIIDQQNQGLANARNTGIQAASNEWIALLDADDIWKPDKLEVVAGHIPSQGGDIYYHPVVTFGLGPKKKRTAFLVKSLDDLLQKGNPIIPSTVVGKTSVFREFPFSEVPDFRLAEDLHLWLRLLHKEKKFCLIDHPLTYYREVGGISTNLDEHIKCVNLVLEHFYNENYYNQTLLNIAMRRKYLESARFHQKRKKFAKAEMLYVAADFKSIKIMGLRFLNFLGISV